jgi:hypothetical protein
MLDGIDKINESRPTNKIDIGIGLAGGEIFLSRLGLKNRKFNIAMGQTVREADKAEDEKAGTLPQNPKSEIVITAGLYEYLCNLAKSDDTARKLMQNFKAFSLSADYYVTSVRYSVLFPTKQAVATAVSIYSYLPAVPHRQKPPWNLPHNSFINIRCQYSADGGKTYSDYQSNGFALPKHASLRFVPAVLPSGWSDKCRVKWQVTNTGAEAQAVGQLRGGIEDSNIELRNGINIGRTETTSYTGTHYVQCFFVRYGTDCIAMSKYFEVRIR